MIQIKAQSWLLMQAFLRQPKEMVMDLGSQVFLIACVTAICLFAATLFVVSLIAPGDRR